MGFNEFPEISVRIMHALKHVLHGCPVQGLDPKAVGVCLRVQGLGLRTQGYVLLLQGLRPRTGGSSLRVQGRGLRAQGDVLCPKAWPNPRFSFLCFPSGSRVSESSFEIKVIWDMRCCRSGALRACLRVQGLGLRIQGDVLMACGGWGWSPGFSRRRRWHLEPSWTAPPSGSPLLPFPLPPPFHFLC
jgi:hypothetical protein